MVQSMTAFARVDTREEWGEAAWEIRSVNHRYLDLNLKIPETFRKFDLAWREILKSKLKRGKVECILIYKPSANSSDELVLNQTLAKQLMGLGSEVSSLMQQKPTLDVIDVLRWPEVVSARQQSIPLEVPLTDLLTKAVGQLVGVRAREGKACTHIMREKLNIIKEQREIALSLAPRIESVYRAKLAKKLEDLKIEVDSNRFEQELVMFLQKIDVMEELDRLQVHIKEVERTLKLGGTVGRRLDFMMQELNREANTLASKSPDPELTKSAVEMKVCIEQLREQIQNLE